MGLILESGSSESTIDGNSDTTTTTNHDVFSGNDRFFFDINSVYNGKNIEPMIGDVMDFSYHDKEVVEDGKDSSTPSSIEEESEEKRIERLMAKNDLKFTGCCHPQGTLSKENFLLTVDEIKRECSRLPGMIIYDRHDLDRPVGIIRESFIDQDGKLIISGMFNNDDLGRKAKHELVTGIFKGLSLGCKHLYDNTEKTVKSSHVDEVSLCEEGQLPQTLIYTYASRNPPPNHQKPYHPQRIPMLTQLHNQENSIYGGDGGKTAAAVVATTSTTQQGDRSILNSQQQKQRDPTLTQEKTGQYSNKIVRTKAMEAPEKTDDNQPSSPPSVTTTPNNPASPETKPRDKMSTGDGKQPVKNDTQKNIVNHENVDTTTMDVESGADKKEQKRIKSVKKANKKFKKRKADLERATLESRLILYEREIAEHKDMINKLHGEIQGKGGSDASNDNSSGYTTYQQQQQSPTGGDSNTQEYHKSENSNSDTSSRRTTATLNNTQENSEKNKGPIFSFSEGESKKTGNGDLDTDNNKKMDSYTASTNGNIDRMDEVCSQQQTPTTQSPITSAQAGTINNNTSATNIQGEKKPLFSSETFAQQEQQQDNSTSEGEIRSKVLENQLKSIMDSAGINNMNEFHSWVELKKKEEEEKKKEELKNFHEKLISAYNNWKEVMKEDNDKSGSHILNTLEEHAKNPRLLENENTRKALNPILEVVTVASRRLGQYGNARLNIDEANRLHKKALRKDENERNELDMFEKEARSANKRRQMHNGSLFSTEDASSLSMMQQDERKNEVDGATKNITLPVPFMSKVSRYGNDDGVPYEVVTTTASRIGGRVATNTNSFGTTYATVIPKGFKSTGSTFQSIGLDTIGVRPVDYSKCGLDLFNSLYESMKRDKPRGYVRHTAIDNDNFLQSARGIQ